VKKYLICSLIAIIIILIGVYFNNQNIDNSYYELGEIAEVKGEIQDDGTVKYSALYELNLGEYDLGSAIEIEFYVQFNNESNKIKNYNVKVKPIGSKLTELNEFRLVETENFIEGLVKLDTERDELFTEYIDKLYYKRFSRKNSIEVLKNENKNIKEYENNKKLIIFKVKSEWHGSFYITFSIDQAKENKAIILIE